jgi:hypothetical protein
MWVQASIESSVFQETVRPEFVEGLQGIDKLSPNEE